MSIRADPRHCRRRPGILKPVGRHAGATCADVCVLADRSTRPLLADHGAGENHLVAAPSCLEHVLRMVPAWAIGARLGFGEGGRGSLSRASKSV